MTAIQFRITAKAAEALSVDDGRVTSTEYLGIAGYLVTCARDEAVALLSDADTRADPRMSGANGWEQPPSWRRVCRVAARAIRSALNDHDATNVEAKR